MIGYYLLGIKNVWIISHSTFKSGRRILGKIAESASDLLRTRLCSKARSIGSNRKWHMLLRSQRLLLKCTGEPTGEKVFAASCQEQNLTSWKPISTQSPSRRKNGTASSKYKSTTNKSCRRLSTTRLVNSKKPLFLMLLCRYQESYWFRQSKPWRTLTSRWIVKSLRRRNKALISLFLQRIKNWWKYQTLDIPCQNSIEHGGQNTFSKSSPIAKPPGSQSPSRTMLKIMN